MRFVREQAKNRFPKPLPVHAVRLASGTFCQADKANEPFVGRDTERALALPEYQTLRTERRNLCHVCGFHCTQAAMLYVTQFRK